MKYHGTITGRWSSDGSHIKESLKVKKDPTAGPTKKLTMREQLDQAADWRNELRAELDKANEKLGAEILNHNACKSKLETALATISQLKEKLFNVTVAKAHLEGQLVRVRHEDVITSPVVNLSESSWRVAAGGGGGQSTFLNTAEPPTVSRDRGTERPRVVLKMNLAQPAPYTVSEPGSIDYMLTEQDRYGVDNSKKLSRSHHWVNS